jgi:hypothetical protein
MGEVGEVGEVGEMGEREEFGSYKLPADVMLNLAMPPSLRLIGYLTLE